MPSFAKLPGKIDTGSQCSVLNHPPQPSLRKKRAVCDNSCALLFNYN